MTFNDKLITDMSQFSKCNAIEGVEVSPEELDALKEAANARIDDDFDLMPDNMNISQPKLGATKSNIESLTQNMNSMGLDEKPMRATTSNIA